jgi:hypothetical protein
VILAEGGHSAGGGVVGLRRRWYERDA